MKKSASVYSKFSPCHTLSYQVAPSTFWFLAHRHLERSCFVSWKSAILFETGIWSNLSGCSWEFRLTWANSINCLSKWATFSFSNRIHWRSLVFGLTESRTYLLEYHTLASSDEAALIFFHSRKGAENSVSKPSLPFPPASQLSCTSPSR